MKRNCSMLKSMLIFALIAAMMLATVPCASAEDLLGGLGDMFSGLLGGDGEEDASFDEDDKPTDFYELMDWYEAFFDEYIEFMASYDGDDDISDLGALADYSSFLLRSAQYLEELDEIDEDELTDEEAAYMLEVEARIFKKLADAGIDE